MFSNIRGVIRIRNRLPGVFNTMESRFPGGFIIGESFWTLGSLYTNFEEYTIIFTGHVILKTDCSSLELLWKMWFMFEKVAPPKVSYRLPGIFITGESITNTNNYLMIIKKKLKSFLDVLIGTRRSCLKKKLEMKNFVTLSLFKLRV